MSEKNIPTKPIPSTETRGQPIKTIHKTNHKKEENNMSDKDLIETKPIKSVTTSSEEIIPTDPIRAIDTYTKNESEDKK